MSWCGTSGGEIAGGQRGGGAGEQRGGGAEEQRGGGAEGRGSRGAEGRLGHLEELIADEDVWSRRLALVATVPINRGRTGLTIPDLTLALIDRVVEERHPMITKAVSWALREMVKTHPDQVAAYLEDNRDVLAAHVVGEVGNKLRTGLKRGKVER
jgi:hypothetical protein